MKITEKKVKPNEETKRIYCYDKADRSCEEHQHYLEWNGDRFRKWAEGIGAGTAKVIDSILRSKRVEQQSYRACMGLLKMADKYSSAKLEEACKTALSYTQSSSYRNVSNILAASKDPESAGTDNDADTQRNNAHGITRGASYYRK